MRRSSCSCDSTPSAAKVTHTRARHGPPLTRLTHDPIACRATAREESHERFAAAAAERARAERAEQGEQAARLEAAKAVEAAKEAGRRAEAEATLRADADAARLQVLIPLPSSPFRRSRGLCPPQSAPRADVPLPSFLLLQAEARAAAAERGRTAAEQRAGVASSRLYQQQRGGALEQQAIRAAEQHAGVLQQRLACATYAAAQDCGGWAAQGCCGCGGGGGGDACGGMGAACMYAPREVTPQLLPPQQQQSPLQPQLPPLQTPPRATPPPPPPPQPQLSAPSPPPPPPPAPLPMASLGEGASLSALISGAQASCESELRELRSALSWRGGA